MLKGDNIPQPIGRSASVAIAASINCALASRYTSMGRPRIAVSGRHRPAAGPAPSGRHRRASRRNPRVTQSQTVAPRAVETSSRPRRQQSVGANAKCHHVNQPDCHQSRSIRAPRNTAESAPGAGIRVGCTAKAHGLHQNANDPGRTPSLHPSLPIRTLR